MIPMYSKVREPLKYAIPMEHAQIFCFQWSGLGPRWALGIGSFLRLLRGFQCAEIIHIDNKDKGI